MSFNKVILLGNLTRDPEYQVTQNGTQVTKLGLAVNEKWGGEDKTVFVDITAFGNTAEKISQYFMKGNKILIDGKLNLDTWQDRDTGANRSKLSVIANSFSFVESKQDAEQSASSSSRGYAPPPPANPPNTPGGPATGQPQPLRQQPPPPEPNRQPDLPSQDDNDEDVPF